MLRPAACLGLVVVALGLLQSSASAQVPGSGTRVVVQMRTPADVDTIAADERRAGSRVHRVFKRALIGMAATMPEARVEALRRNPRVVAITPDLPMPEPPATQSAPAWSLDRIDQRDGSYDEAYTYDTTGAGVTVYVLDTGVRTTHVEFGGRASTGLDLIDGTGTDCYDHGTMAAGAIAGATSGVAKAARIVSVRYWGCHGPNSMVSDVIAGLDWIVADGRRPAVVNASVGSGPVGAGYEPIETAIQRTVAAGLAVVWSADNDGVDACTQSPARAPAAITVAASTSYDARALFSNYGSCVDMYAPGQGVPDSASSVSDTATRTGGGTSIAAPFVSGAIARHLETHPSASPADIESWLVGNATAGIITDSRFTTSNLLYTPLASTGDTHPVSVTKGGSGSGTVTSQPAGISCGSTCSASFAGGSSVTLTAAAATGSSFTGWTGDCSGAALTCTVTVTSARSVTATFAPSSVTVNDATVGTTSNTFSYAGTWGVSKGSLKFMGDDHWSTTTGSSYTLRFTGTQVKLYGAKAPHHGQATVSVDGGTATTVDLYSSTRQDNVVVFQSAALASQAHTVKVTVKGTKNASSSGYGISVDRAVVSTPTQVTVNDAVLGTAPDAFSYAGTWRTSTAIAAKYLGDDHWSSTTASSYTFRFTGTQVALYGAKASSHGHASIQVDGGTTTTVDQYAATRQDNVLIYRSPVLTAGPHAVRVTVKGTKNASATNYTIAVDRAVATR